MAFIAYIAPLILSFCLPSIIKLCVVKFELWTCEGSKVYKFGMKIWFFNCNLL